VFSDNFDRTASATVGNGWTEKTDHFSIQNNQLVNVSSADDGYFNIVCLPPLVARDVQVDMDVTFPTTDTKIEADPSIVVRAPDDTVATYNTYDGYTFYIYRDEAGIDREEKPADTATNLATQTISPALAMGVAYHMRFSVIGTNPPKIDATVTDTRNGNVVATLTFVDNDTAKRYTAAGHVGIGTGTRGQNVKFDNFVETSFDP
jgi:hypothetical protein